MRNKHGWKRVMLAALVMVMAATAFAGSKDGKVEQNAQDEAKRLEILGAINDFATYCTDVLLDEDGKSRCDYNLVEGKWYPYEPAWHTGQVIYGLVEAYEVTGNEKYLKEAKRAGDWWVGLQIKDHPVLNGMVHASHGDIIGDRIIFATTSDGTPGLFRLWEVTKEDKYARVPTEAGEWMMNNMYEPNSRLFYDTVEPESGEVMKENSPFWADEIPKEQQTLFNLARPNNEGSLFKDMYEYSGDERYKKMFVELCESLLDYQDEWGLWMDFMPNHKEGEGGSYHPRFNLWYAESLFEGYDLTGDKRYLEAGIRTLRTYAKAQTEIGTVYYVNFVDGTYEKHSITGSATAFLGLLSIRAVGYGYPEFNETIERSLDWVLTNRFPADHPDPNLAGSLLNLRSRVRHDKHWITMRDVGTSFGLRFLCDYTRATYGVGEQSE